MCVCVCVGQDRASREFHGRQFVCSSRNLLAKLHDHKLCSRNLFTCQRGRWRFNYTVAACSLALSHSLPISFPPALCAGCDIGEIPGWLPRFLGAQQILRNEQKLASGKKKKVHCHWKILFFGSESREEGANLSRLLASYHLGKRPLRSAAWSSDIASVSPPSPPPSCDSHSPSNPWRLQEMQLSFRWVTMVRH